MAEPDTPSEGRARGAPGLPEDGEVDVYDIAVVGAGPAGLHAALKAALLYKTCILFDKGRRHSRIFYAPKVDNIPGYPAGTPGREIIDEGYRHIETIEKQLGRRFVDIRANTEVIAVEREPLGGAKHDLFVLRHRSKESEETAKARNLVIATGVVDQQPVTQEYRRRDVETILPYANKGLAGYCLLCDAHLVEGQRIAVIGCGESAGSVAASLKKNFDARPVLVTCGGVHPDHLHEGPVIPEETKTFLAERGIPIIDKPIKGWFGLAEESLGIEFVDGTKETFDKGWISMGWYKVNSDLAVALGAATAEDGTIRTDENCEVVDEDGEKIRGLFAIGDVRDGSWKQIPIAVGEAELAVIHAFATHL